MSVLLEWPADALPSVLLVLAPHPDDDVLGCSLLMRRVTAAGAKVIVVWLTDGGASHGALGPADRQRLTERRREEALAGVAALGVTPQHVEFLNYPDGALAEHVDEARARLRILCLAHAVDTVVATDEGDGHPDHRAAFQIATGLSAPRLYSYPISTRYDGEPYSPPNEAVYIAGEDGDFKRFALRQHYSQSSAGGATYPLSAATIDRFCAGPELFIPIRTAS